jgi:hypothetical protein
VQTRRTKYPYYTADMRNQDTVSFWW